MPSIAASAMVPIPCLMMCIRVIVPAHSLSGACSPNEVKRLLAQASVHSDCLRAVNQILDAIVAFPSRMGISSGEVRADSGIGIAERRFWQDDAVRASGGTGPARRRRPCRPDRHRSTGIACRLVERARSRISRLRPDHSCALGRGPRNLAPTGLQAGRHRHAARHHHGDPERHFRRRADCRADPTQPA